MNVLSLFSGIGGLELGLERAGMTVVGQVEIDPFCRQVLAKHWPEVPRHDDVRTTVQWWVGESRPAVDVVCGGFPCQPVSVAGLRLAQEDERWLWPSAHMVIRELRPAVAILENVPGLLGRGMGDVLGDLAEIGYDAEWDCVPAAAVGAPHRRDRVFVVAYPHRDGGRHESVAFTERPYPADSFADGTPQPVADAAGEGRGSRRIGQSGARAARLQDEDRAEFAGGAWWAVEPAIRRVAYGVPGRVDRLRALGNAVVPQVAEHIGRLVMGAVHA